MTFREFSELCRKSADLLNSLADQSAGGGDDELVFDNAHVAEHVNPLSRIVTAICASAKE